MLFYLGKFLTESAKLASRVIFWPDRCKNHQAALVCKSTAEIYLSLVGLDPKTWQKRLYLQALSVRLLQQKIQSQLESVSQWLTEFSSPAFKPEKQPELEAFLKRAGVDEKTREALLAGRIERQRLVVAYEGTRGMMRTVHSIYKGWPLPIWTRWLTVLQVCTRYIVCMAYFLARVFFGLGRNIKFGQDNLLEHTFGLDWNDQTDAQFVFCLTMWFIAIIIAPVELYNATMLSTDRNKNRRDALRLEFHKHWCAAMLYLLKGDEVLRDMSFLFCTIGGSALVLSPEQIAMVHFHRQVAQIALFHSMAVLWYRDGLSEVHEAWLWRYTEDPAAAELELQQWEPKYTAGDPGGVALHSLQLWHAGQPQRHRKNRLKRAVTFLLGRERTQKMNERKIGRFKNETRRVKGGLKSTPGADTATNRSDFRAAEIQVVNELKQLDRLDLPSSDGETTSRKPKKQYFMARAIDLKRADQYHDSAIPESRDPLERARKLNSWKSEQERIKYTRLADHKNKQEAQHLEEDPSSPSSEDDEKNLLRPRAIVEEETRFFETVRDSTSLEYAARRADHTKILAQRCSRVHQPIARPDPPSISVHGRPVPAAARIITRWCRARRKKLKALRDADAEANPGQRIEQLIIEEEEDDEEAEMLDQGLEPAEDDGVEKALESTGINITHLLCPTLITRFRRIETGHWHWFLIIDVVLSPASFKGQWIQRREALPNDDASCGFVIKKKTINSDLDGSEFDLNYISPFWTVEVRPSEEYTRAGIFLGKKLLLQAEGTKQQEAAKTEHLKEVITTLSAAERAELDYNLGQALKPAFGGVVNPSAKDRVVLINQRLNIGLPVESIDPPVEQPNNSSAAASSSSSSSSGDKCAAAKSGKTAEEGMSAQEYKSFQKQRKKAQAKLLPGRIDGFRVVEDTDRTTAKSTGRSIVRLKARVTDPLLAKTFCQLLPSPYMDMRCMAKSNPNRSRRLGKSDTMFYCEAMLNLWAVRTRFVVERGSTHVVNPHVSPGANQLEHLRQVYNLYCADIKDYALELANGDPKKIKEVEEELSIPDSMLEKLTPMPVGHQWHDFPDSEDSDPEEDDGKIVRKQRGDTNYNVPPGKADEGGALAEEVERLLA
ncbi:unnamed protein product [Amoebophrya sp. A25]|nr:unnamed protein product [Amoebophrya sp. A25]|eukprot:GSA25T00017317001.1